ncbi:hypothetical protein HPB51_015095 [Rhipicephalus microplus]|uniref:Uncharacterized protein n=1 Tax=Rhipicephalus microplus TaxID=6941 RepID=A0A9J6ETW7_RHIMP|nr:hypothetical protein HPB51_015095 [Rhipicephalus microplus]
MAPSVRVLLVLAHLAVMVVGKHGSGRVQDKYQSDRCKKLMRMIMWCGSEKDWKNEIQRKMAAHMGGSNFTDEVDECLAASLDPDDRMSYCTDIKSHCVKVNMGMMEADLGMSNDEETGPSDDDDDDEYYKKLDRPKKDKESDGRRRHNHRKGQYSRPVREQDNEVPDEFNRHRPYPEIHQPRKRVPYGDDDDGTYILHMWSSDDDEEVKQRYKWPQRRQPAVYDEDRHDHHNHRDEQGGHYARMVRKQDHRKQTRPFHKDLRHKRRPLHDDGINRHEGRVRKNRNKWHNDRETNGRDKRPHEVFGVQRRGQHRRPLGDRDMMNRHDRH